MVCYAGWRHKGSSYLQWESAGCILLIQPGMMCEDLGLGPQATRPICLWVFKSLQTRLRHTFELPRAEFRDRSKLLKLNNETWCTLIHSVHTSSYDLHYRKSSEWANVDDVVHARSHGRSSQNLLVPTVIWYPGRSNPGCGQEDYSVKQSHVNLNSYRPPTRPENEGQEPMDLCYAEIESSRVTI